MKIEPTDENLRLLEMAIYQETHGLMKPTTASKIIPRWKYFKRLIRRGSFKTVDDLEARIYGIEIATTTPDKFLRDDDGNYGQN